MNEVWKKIIIEGVEGYEVSSEGRMRSLVWGKYLKLCNFTERNGYLRVNITKRQFKKKKTVHRLIAEAFIPNPNSLPEVNHKNGNKSDNRVINLEWCSKSENALHSVKIGTNKIKGGYKMSERVPIIRILPDGSTIKKYEAIHQVKKDGFPTVSVARALKSGNPYRGYIWKYI